MARKNSLSFFKTLSTILFLVIIFLCIQYYIGREITASNNSFKDIHWTTGKKYFIELEQLDGVFFHITINGVIDKNDELFIEIKNAKEDKRQRDVRFFFKLLKKLSNIILYKIVY